MDHKNVVRDYFEKKLIWSLNNCLSSPEALDANAARCIGKQVIATPVGSYYAQCDQVASNQNNKLCQSHIESEMKNKFYDPSGGVFVKWQTRQEMDTFLAQVKQRSEENRKNLLDEILIFIRAIADGNVALDLAVKSAASDLTDGDQPVSDDATKTVKELTDQLRKLEMRYAVGGQKP